MPPGEIEVYGRRVPREFPLAAHGYFLSGPRRVNRCHGRGIRLVCIAMQADRVAILENLRLLAELFEIRDRTYNETAESLAARLKLNDLIEALVAEIKQDAAV